jgi:hypothetical protein
VVFDFNVDQKKGWANFTASDAKTLQDDIK